jgi:hypothetical protein
VFPYVDSPEALVSADLNEFVSTELEVVAKYCTEGKVLTRTVTDNEGILVKTWEMVAKRSRTAMKARRVTVTMGVQWRRRLVGDSG